MTDPSVLHFSADEIDAFLSGDLPGGRAAHLHACSDCREAVEGERELVTQLAALPAYAPAATFVDRVMARVSIPDPFALRAVRTLPARLLASRPTLLRVAAVAAVLAVLMGGSILWSWTNQDVLRGLGTSALGEATGWFWLGLQGLVSNLVEQPWYGGAKAIFGSPARLAFLSAAASLLYVGGILALKRLMALPVERVAHAHM